MGKKRNMLLCPFQSGGFTPVYCDGDKCELFIKAHSVGGVMMRGACAVYWSGLIARAQVAKELGVSAENDVTV